MSLPHHHPNKTLLIPFLLLLIFSLHLLSQCTEAKSIYISGPTNDITDYRYNMDCLTPETACTAKKAFQDFTYKKGDEVVIVGEMHCSKSHITMSYATDVDEIFIRGHDEHAVITEDAIRRDICIVPITFSTPSTSPTLYFSSLHFKHIHSRSSIFSSSILFQHSFDNCLFDHVEMRFGGTGTFSMKNSTVQFSEYSVQFSMDKNPKAVFWDNVTIQNSTRLRIDHSSQPHEHASNTVLHLSNSMVRFNSSVFISGQYAQEVVDTKLRLDNILVEHNHLSDEEDVFVVADIRDVHVSNSTFRNNRAHASCIFFQENALMMNVMKSYTVESSRFENNVGFESCIIFSGSYSSTVKDSSFIGNSITSYGFFEKGTGAIKYKDDSKSSKFFSYAPYFGSIVQNTEFSGNSGWHAGAVYVEGYIRVLFTDVTFSHNMGRIASALYFYGFFGALNGGTLYNNTQDIANMDDDDRFAGVISVYGGQFAIRNSSITLSNQNGILVNDADSINLVGVHISHTQTGLYVDKRCTQSDIYVGAILPVWKTYFSFLDYPNRLNISSVFEHNNASAIIIESFRNARFNNMTIRENHHTRGGGMKLRFDRPQQSMHLDALNIENNRATLYGGGLYIQFIGTPGNVRFLDEVRVHNNVANQVGGGLFIDIDEISCSVYFAAQVAANSANYGDDIFWEGKVIDLPQKLLSTSTPQRFEVVPHKHLSDNHIPDESDGYEYGEKENARLSHCHNYVGNVVYSRKYSCSVLVNIFDSFNNSITSDSLPTALSAYFSPSKSQNGIIFDSPLAVRKAGEIPAYTISESDPLLNQFLGKESNQNEQFTVWNLTFTLTVHDESALIDHYMGAPDYGLSINILLNDTDSRQISYEIPLALPDCPSGLISHDGMCVTFISVYWMFFFIPSIGVFCSILLFIILVATIVVLCVVSVFKIRSSHLEKKNRFYKTLDDDIKMLLLDRESNEGLPRIKMNKKLFEIPFEQIKLCKKIGSGGQCTVYEVEWKGIPAAFKVFPSSTFNDSGFFDAFESEVNILSSCRHPGIIGFYGCTMKDLKIGIVLELCNRGSIRSYMESIRELGESLPFSKKVHILLEVARCLDYLHRVSVVHRDLKAENILLTDDLSPRIIDFGLSKLMEERTKHTIRIGTRTAMAPELVRGSDYTNKVDVYSFAILMYQMLTENFEVYGSEEQHVEVKVANDASFRPRINEESIEDFEGKKWFIELMQTCWQHDPLARPSFEDIVHQMEKKVGE